MQQNVERFLAPQESYYDEALKEIKSGSKSGHWIWWIFPQMRGLGFSPWSQKYGIESLYEAHAYFEHPVLKERLREITHALLVDAYDITHDIEEILGPVDAMKVKSCMTLFDVVSPNEIFDDTLNCFYNRERDEKTLKMIERDKEFFESSPFENYGVKVNPRAFFESNVEEAHAISSYQRAATIIDMYLHGENINDLVCWYQVNKRDIFYQYRNNGIVSTLAFICSSLYDEYSNDADKEKNKLAQKMLSDFYKENDMDRIYNHDDPLEVADVLMKEVDFLYKEPFCTDFKYKIDYYSLIEKPWRKK